MEMQGVTALSNTDGDSNGNMLAICDLGHPMTSNLCQRDHTVQELLFRYIVYPQVDRSTPGSRPGVQYCAVHSRNPRHTSD